MAPNLSILPSLLKLKLLQDKKCFKMSQVFLLCLILGEAFLGLAMASESTQHILHSKAASSSQVPAPSPSSSQNLRKVEAPSTRKLGKHQPTAVISPSEAPQATTTSNDHQAASNEPNSEENLSVQGQEVHLKTNHHSIDKSVAGGGVILGGLATTFIVAVFCYIRATGRHKAENQSSAV